MRIRAIAVNDVGKSVPSELGDSVGLLVLPGKMLPPVDHEASYTNNTMTLVWTRLELVNSGSTPVTNYTLYMDNIPVHRSMNTNHSVSTVGLQTYNFSL